MSCRLSVDALSSLSADALPPPFLADALSPPFLVDALSPQPQGVGGVVSIASSCIGMQHAVARNLTIVATHCHPALCPPARSSARSPRPMLQVLAIRCCHCHLAAVAAEAIAAAAAISVTTAAAATVQFVVAVLAILLLLALPALLALLALPQLQPSCCAAAFAAALLL